MDGVKYLLITHRTAIYRTGCCSSSSTHRLPIHSPSGTVRLELYKERGYVQNPLQLPLPLPPRRLLAHKRLALLPPFPFKRVLSRDESTDMREEAGMVVMGGLVVHNETQGGRPCCYTGGVCCGFGLRGGRRRRLRLRLGLSLRGGWGF